MHVLLLDVLVSQWIGWSNTQGICSHPIRAAEVHMPAGLDVEIHEYVYLQRRSWTWT